MGLSAILLQKAETFLQVTIEAQTASSVNHYSTQRESNLCRTECLALPRPMMVLVQKPNVTQVLLFNIYLSSQINWPNIWHNPNTILCHHLAPSKEFLTPWFQSTC